jgi:hypothetical protein
VGVEALATGASDGTSGRRWVSTRVAVSAALAVVIVALGAFGTRLWLDRRATIDEVVTEVAATREEVARTEALLDSATAGLVTARSVLGEQRAALTAREGERVASEGTMTATGEQLVALQTQLAAATADLQARTTERSVLDRCLLGVAKALNQASVGDTGGLARTVREVEGICTLAGAAV